MWVFWSLNKKEHDLNHYEDPCKGKGHHQLNYTRTLLRIKHDNKGERCLFVKELSA